MQLCTATADAHPQQHGNLETCCRLSARKVSATTRPVITGQKQMMCASALYVCCYWIPPSTFKTAATNTAPIGVRSPKLRLLSQLLAQRGQPMSMGLSQRDEVTLRVKELTIQI